ncbi:DNA methyltransferase [Xanthomonas campestris pv. campestris]|nr:DNA methyltransferase [Xanthomonas campestris pv. campestris]
MSDLFQNHAAKSGPVECLGQTFPSDDARREHYLKLLAEKLKDPEFRKIEGFPQGTDEAILKMSDPPYYTACPNPFLEQFVSNFGRDYQPTETYAREPLAIDVSVGKFDPLYKAHSYHTKVPHLAIVPSILHYTEPGDLVLDGFCGSGMTGVAAQWCETAPASYRAEIESECRAAGRPAPKWGMRRAILSDLSPAATFIAAGYNTTFDVHKFEAAAKRMLEELKKEIGWMYTTTVPGNSKALMEYTVWSEVFLCHSCSGEIIFEKVGVDRETFKIHDEICCPHCGVRGRKEEMELLYESKIDPITGIVKKLPKRVPTEIYYKKNGDLVSKEPDADDLSVLSKIEQLPFPPEFPSKDFPDSQMKRVGRMTTTNTNSISDIFVTRAAHTMATLWRKADQEPDTGTRRFLRFMVEQAIWGLSALNRYQPSQHLNYGGSQVNRQLNGVYYIASMYAECSPWHNLDGKVKRLASAFKKFVGITGASCIATGSAGRLGAPDSSIDYIFTDPPFGENIYYADLNFLVESWHGVITNELPEAIIDRVRGKGVFEYQVAMERCFAEYHRVLKPGRWMTVVFSNSKAAVWNAIQVSLQKAGFVVAEVAALDKKQGSFKQVTSTTAVKQDLVISVYKPNGGLERRLAERGATPESVWDFVQTHLKQLSITKPKDGGLEFIAERDPRRIYDRMVGWFVRHDVPVPLSSGEFLDGLRQRFPDRDGMVFLPEQVAEYDKKRALVSQAPQMELFVSDERSAIDWLTDFLKRRPSTYQELHPEFITQLGAGWKKHEWRPELSGLLEENFIQYDGVGDVPSQIHSYLSSNWPDLRNLDKGDSRLTAKAKDRWYVPDPNKAKDLEKKREKGLLKEFDTYRAFSGRRLKEFRLEVLRAGFRTAWGNKDYKTIIDIAKKVPEEALQEDEKLLTLYDLALTRTEDGI